jgi:hypothetical protein
MDSNDMDCHWRVLCQYERLGLEMVAELARVRFFVEALKSGDSSYPKILPGQSTS